MTAAARRIHTLYRTELRTVLRDRRMVAMSLVLPLLVMPIMLFAGRWMEERRERQLAARDYSYSVTGSRAEEARRWVAGAVASPADGTDRATFREVTTADADAALQSGEVDVYVAAGTVADLLVRAAADSAVAARIDPEERLRTLPGELLALSLVYRGDRDSSDAGANRLRARLRDARLRARSDTIANAGFALAEAGFMPVEPMNLAAATQVAGLALGRIATLLLLMFLFTGGAVVAQDTLAGEKERGTLETLLTTAASRREIVAAKLLLVLTVAVTITTIQVGNLLVYAQLQLVPSAALAGVMTLSLAAGLLLFLLPLAALISAALLLVSGYAKSYREAQFNFMPILLLSAMPALAAMLPGISLRSAIVVVPIANISVGVRELLIGRVDLPFLIVAWLVTASAAAGIARMTERALSNERLIVPSVGEARARDGGPALTAGAVFSWFAAMWAVLLLVSLNLGQSVDIRVQVLVNLVGIFLTGSFLLLRRYKLPARDTLLLRPPPWQAWIGVAAGAPAALVTGVGVARVANLVVPVPEEVLEGFGQYLAPDDISLWQLLPMLTVVPGICEEIAFRGVLLQSLRRFFRPWTAALMVGLIFGLFHVSLFRLFPTAFLGLILAAVTILSGSIFPAMVWHALNNGISLLANHYNVAIGLLPAGGYAAGAAILALSFWILWRTRRS